MRPRCREWLPLATQQFRLRNLVKIHGINIELNQTEEEVLIYYTLHHTKDGLAFYESETLPHRNLQLKWAEIVCSEMLKSSSNCVCVKVWAHYKNARKCSIVEQQETDIEQQEVVELHKPISALSKVLSHNACLSPNNLLRPPDKLLFTWAVYFSGLILISQQKDTNCCANSLIFQINADFFASPEHFTTDSLREQLSQNYQRYSECVPKYSLPQSDEFSINSPKVSRSSSPIELDGQHRDLVQMSKIRYVQLCCPRTDVRKSYSLDQLLDIQEYQRLHLQRQRECLETAMEIKQISLRCITTEQVLLRTKSRRTSLSTSNSLQHHSMGRTLSHLLAEQDLIEPATLLRAQKLQEELETIRCRQRLLQSERGICFTRNAKLKQRIEALEKQRIEKECWLEQKWNSLRSDKYEMREKYQQLLMQQQQKRQIALNVERRMSTLCMELREIYPIGRNQLGFHTINGVPFPKVDFYAANTSASSSSSAVSSSIEHLTPLGISASLGYVAHLVQMIANVNNRPLRNPIIHEGSRSRIMDVIKDLPYTTREFPLYCRSTILSKPVKYAIFLLNQNIAQLCFDITGIRCDLRATIENISHIFATLADTEQRQRDSYHTTKTQTHPNNRLALQQNEQEQQQGNGMNFIHDHDSSNSGTYGAGSVDCCLSNSHSSVDMNHEVLPPSLPSLPSSETKLVNLLQMPQQIASHIGSQPIVIAERTGFAVGENDNVTHQRICRSAGSYTDSEEDFKHHHHNMHNTLRSNSHSYSNSDSNITAMQRDNI